MTKQEQQIAIAEICGWIRKPEFDWTTYDNVKHLAYSHKDTTFIRDQYGLPNYPQDLNAMHGAEKSLKSGHDYWKFVEWLISIVKRDDLPFIKDGVSATASQRAEAFLRTVGKWKD